MVAGGSVPMPQTAIAVITPVPPVLPVPPILPPVDL
jgi:hypothetical protein